MKSNIAALLLAAMIFLVFNQSLSLAQVLFAAGEVQSSDTGNYSDSDSSTSSVVPVFVDLQIPFIQASARTEYGSNRVAWATSPYVIVNDGHYSWTGSGCTFTSSWTDNFTLSGAVTRVAVFFYHKSGSSDFETLPGGNAYLFISVNGEFIFGAPHFEFVLPGGTGSFDARITNGVPFNVTFSLSGNGGQFECEETGSCGSPTPPPARNFSAGCRLKRILLPQGATLTSASGQVYPTVNVSATPEISLSSDKQNIILHWFSYTSGFSLLTTTNLADPSSWNDAVNLPGSFRTVSSDGIEFTQTVPIDEDARFFRLDNSFWEQ